MKFHYYYDLDKTHELLYDLKTHSITTLNDGRIALTFDASISERVNDKILAMETSIKTFIFMPDDTNLDLHELTVSRYFIAAQGKWILEVKNRQNENESLTIGLLTETRKQPLLLEVEHEGEYNVIAQANTLSRIESEYAPPLISQTRLSYSFDEPGLPDEITSKSVLYDASRKAITLSDMVIKLTPLSLVGAQFETSMQIVPDSVTPASGTEHIFTLDIEGIGRFEALKSGLQYTANRVGSRPVKVDWKKPIEMTDLETYYVHPEATFSVKGDGVKEITAMWNGIVLKAPYSPATQRPGKVTLESGKKARV